MWIGVAARARGERHRHKRLALVAGLAGHLGVGADERELRLRVVEGARGRRERRGR